MERRPVQEIMTELVTLEEAVLLAAADLLSAFVWGAYRVDMQYRNGRLTGVRVALRIVPHDAETGGASETP